MNDDLKISEIREKFDGQWVIVEVTKVDKYDNPLHGRVLFNGKDQDKIYGQGRKYRDEHPTADLFYFFAGHLIPQDIGVMFALF